MCESTMYNWVKENYPDEDYKEAMKIGWITKEEYQKLKRK